MTRKRRTQQSSNMSFTANQLKRKKPINLDYIREIEPITENQKKFFDAYDGGKHLVAYGCSGTGKSFITLYKAFKEVLDETNPYEKIYICRSIVATRDPGALPGDLNEKVGVFETPYKNMVDYMFYIPEDPTFELYSSLKHQNTIEFITTSFIRGNTFNDCVIVVDEFSNLNFHELDSIITRVGENCRIIFCGDAEQSDLINTNERNGIHDFIKILQIMPSFEILEFGVNDIVRSGLVKEYILAKRELGVSII